MLIGERVVYYQVEDDYLIFPETRMKVIDIVGGRLRVITSHGRDILVMIHSEEEGAGSGYRVEIISSKVYES